MFILEDEKVDFIHQRIERSADYYLKKYRPQMEALESLSPLAKVRGITTYDYYALGEQLDQFHYYVQYLQESGAPGTTANLGKLPNVAMDIITAAYGASIVPILCSVQPIEEEQGMVYFKRTYALDSRGNVTANQILRQPHGVPQVYARGYAGEMVTGTLVTTVNETLEYNGTLNTKVRPNTITLKITTGGGSNLKAVDDGEGNLLGVGMQGGINYNTGAWTLTFMDNPGDSKAVTVSYGSDYEAGANIPRINTETASIPIRAETFVLKSQVGLFKSFAMQKRFGRLAEDEMIQDITNELTAEIGQEAINRLVAEIPTGNALTWTRVPAEGVSWMEHKQELLDVIARSEANLLAQVGRGTVNLMIGGPTACAYLQNMPGFVKATINGTGPQVYGNLNGITVIRTPQTDLVSEDDLYPIYKGTGHFDAPIVYAPFMPLFVSGTLPVPDNVLQKQGFAAVWAGLKVVAPGFCTKITVASGD